MQIPPLSLSNDVRHPGLSDAMNAATFSTITQQLAQRDFAISQKINEVIKAFSALQQYGPLPILRFWAPAEDTLTVTSFRVPAGYKAAVLNAIVSGVGVTSGLTLTILHSSETFGLDGTGAVKLVETTSESSVANPEYVRTGEIIVQVENTNTKRVETSVSVLLAFQPV